MPQPTASSSSAADPGTAATVLIVEDNALNMRLFTDLLESEGYSILQCRDGAKAVSFAQAHAPDLILMDIQLPEVSGLDITRWLKDDSRTKAIPILAVTAFATREDERQVRAAGCDEYMSKPIQIDGFIRAVGRLVQEGRERGAAGGSDSDTLRAAGTASGPAPATHKPRAPKAPGRPHPRGAGPGPSGREAGGGGGRE